MTDTATTERPTEAPATVTPDAPPAIANVGEASSSPTIGNLIGALAKAQGAMAHAAKDANNPHFGKSYAELSSVIDAAKEPLSANGIAMIQRNLDCRDGVRVQSILAHESGEWISDGVLYMPVAPADVTNPQRYGAAQTYARRYAYMTMVGLAPADDDANSASPAPAGQQQAAAPGASVKVPFGPLKGKALNDPAVPDSELSKLSNLRTTNEAFRAKDDQLRAAAAAELGRRAQVAGAARAATPAQPVDATKRAAEDAGNADLFQQAQAADEDIPFPDAQPETPNGPVENTWSAEVADCGFEYDRMAPDNDPTKPVSGDVAIHLRHVVVHVGKQPDMATATTVVNGVIAHHANEGKPMTNGDAYIFMRRMIEDFNASQAPA